MARRDAENNRQQILAVAMKAFAASPVASLNSIAKAAGIGPGTLYRHFPTREALVLAVYQNEIQQMVDFADAVLAKHPPLEAMRTWLERVAYHIRVKHGMADALNAAMTESAREASYGPMIAATERLVTAAVKAGAMRKGLDAEDLLHLVGFLWRLPPGKKGEVRARRLLDFVMAGLKPG